MPAFPQSIGPAGGRSPRSPAPKTTQRVDVVLVDLDAERADGGDRRLGVGRAAEARDAGLAVAERARSGPRGARSTCRRERRCARRAARRARPPSGSLARSPARRRRRSPEPRADCAARSASRLARDEDRQRAAALVREVVHVEVRDVDPLRAERLEDAASTPGRSGRWTRSRWSAPGSSYAVSSIRRRLPLASPIQRARKPASPAASAPRPARSGAGAPRGRRASSSRFSRKMSTQMRGLAPAMRVMSRRDPPAAVSGSCPSMRDAPAWLTQQVGERVRQMARHGDQAVVGAGIDRDRARARPRRRDCVRRGSTPGRSSRAG